jgi:hypothetical protein
VDDNNEAMDKALSLKTPVISVENPGPFAEPTDTAKQAEQATTTDAIAASTENITTEINETEANLKDSLSALEPDKLSDDVAAGGNDPTEA